MSLPSFGDPPEEKSCDRGRPVRAGLTSNPDEKPVSAPATKSRAGGGLPVALILQGKPVDLQAELGKLLRRVEEDEHEGDRLAGLDVEVGEG